MTEDVAPFAPRRTPVFLIVLSVVVPIVAILSFAPLLMSFMAFDAGVTAQATATFIGIWMVPVVMVLALLAAWIGYAAGSRLAMRIAIGICLIPLGLLGILACVTISDILFS